METDSCDDSAVDALAFLELADANISPLNDTDAWETTLDHLHEAAEVDSAMLSEVLDEVVRGA